MDIQVKAAEHQHVRITLVWLSFQFRVRLKGAM